MRYHCRRMKTTVQLDYSAVLANTAQPVHLVLQFDAPAVAPSRGRPVAFSVVLDRSGSMSGPPLAAACHAARTVVNNLRRDDLFSLVVFDDEAQTVHPLAPVTSRQRVHELINRIVPGSSTNLTAGWMLGRDHLKSAPPTTLKRQLLLTDGELNVGIVEPERVKRIVAAGLETDGVRTSCLGFGDGYNEDLLAALATSSGGTFYDANQPDRLPGIFAAELDGLQRTAVQNLRLRFRPLDFVERLAELGDYASTRLPDGRIEFPIGDLVSEEQRVAVFFLQVMPIPLVAPGTPAATLDGEALLEVEIVFDEIQESGVTSHAEHHTVRVRPTQDPADVRVNETVLPWVTAQQAADLMEKAIARRDAGDLRGARRILSAGIARLRAYERDQQTSEARHLLEETNAKLADDAEYARSRKNIRYSSSTLKRMRSAEHWVGEGPAPSFVKPPPASPQGDSNPHTRPKA